MIYLVLEFDSQIIYLPFKSLQALDEYTLGFDNPLELVASTTRILGLDIPKEMILDAYISSSLDNVNDDMQEFKYRYLSIKYRRDNYVINDLERNFISYFKDNFNKSDFSSLDGLMNVFDNYSKKYLNDREVKDKDLERVALLYLGNDYKRHKNSYYVLKDNNYKTRVKNKMIDYSNQESMDKEDEMLLVMGTGMSIQELKEYVSKEENKGKKK